MTNFEKTTLDRPPQVDPPGSEPWREHLIGTREDILGDFYRVLSGGKNLRDYHIPVSDVFYVREAVYIHTGYLFSLDFVESVLIEEGYIPLKYTQK